MRENLVERLLRNILKKILDRILGEKKKILENTFQK